MTGVAGAEAACWQQMSGLDTCHVGKRAVAGVAEAGDRDAGVIAGQIMAKRVAFDTGVGIAIADGGDDFGSGTGVAGVTGVTVTQMHGFNAGPGGKGAVTTIASAIRRDVVSCSAMWCMAFGAGVGIAVVDGGDDLRPGAAVTGSTGPTTGG